MTASLYQWGSEAEEIELVEAGGANWDETLMRSVSHVTALILFGKREGSHGAYVPRLCTIIALCPAAALCPCSQSVITSGPRLTCHAEASGISRTSVTTSAQPPVKSPTPPAPTSWSCLVPRHDN